MTKHEELQTIGANAYNCIKEMVKRLDLAGDGNSEEDALEQILEDALEITIRSDWCSHAEYPGPPGEFKILLTTGGPAVRIVGRLDEDGMPVSGKVRLEIQDWFTPWTEYMGGDQAILLRYAKCFEFDALF